MYIADPDNKELIISVETVNYASKKVPLMIIFSGTHYLQKHFNNDIDNNIF